MRRVLLAVTLLTVNACQSSIQPHETPLPSPGEFHNQFLSELHGALDGPHVVSPEDADAVVYAVTNRTLERFGGEPMTLDEIKAALAWGVEISQMDDPWQLVRPYMSASDHKWLMRYVSDAEVHEARAVFERHCARYGTPAEGSNLWICTDILVSSAEYWYARHGERPGKGDIGPQPAWWKRVLRFVTVTAADGLGGTAATGGTGGNVVAGLVVGGLCSHAVNDIVFGGGYGD